MNRSPQLLRAGALVSFVVALIHVACVFTGEATARFFNAPRFVIALIQQHSLWIVPVAVAIASILGGFGLLAWSGAGLMRRLPLLRTGLVTVTTIYLLRGLIIVPLTLFALQHPGRIAWPAFLFCLVALGVGLLYLCGTIGRWRALSAPPNER